MRDLEQASGVSRETIRYYIREGLLPEPCRTHRNSATYSSDHLERLLTIRRLKDERFLPLAVIRSLLTGDGADLPPEQLLPGIDRLLRQRLDAEGETTPAHDLIAEMGGEADSLDELTGAGVVALLPGGRVSPRDTRIVRLVIDAQRLGFNRERGYLGQEIGRLAGLMRGIADVEVREFFARVAPHVGEAEAADMAERGIGILTRLMSELFTREVLALLDERRESALRTAPAP